MQKDSILDYEGELVVRIICNYANRMERKDTKASMEMVSRNRFSAVGMETFWK